MGSANSQLSRHGPFGGIGEEDRSPEGELSSRDAFRFYYGSVNAKKIAAAAAADGKVKKSGGRERNVILQTDGSHSSAHHESDNIMSSSSSDDAEHCFLSRTVAVDKANSHPSNKNASVCSDDTEKQSNEPIHAFQQPAQKSSAYNGVCKPPRKSRYRTHIDYDNKRHFMGYYQLESDAALAYDEAAKLLKGPSSKLNFNTKKEHIEAREIEIKRRGLDLDDAAFLWCLRYAKRRGAREREKRKERGKEKRKKRGKGEEMLFSLNPSLFSHTLHEKRNPLL
jgi:hypothetical protein